MAEDWAAWADAWRALDAGLLAQAMASCERGESVSLTLCGERSAQRFESRPRSVWQRLQGHWQTTEVTPGLEAL